VLTKVTVFQAHIQWEADRLQLSPLKKTEMQKEKNAYFVDMMMSVVSHELSFQQSQLMISIFEF